MHNTALLVIQNDAAALETGPLPVLEFSVCVEKVGAECVVCFIN